MNSLFNVLNHSANGGNMVSQFISFMQQNKGQNPNQIINNLLSSGRLTQDQLNSVQAQAKQMQSQFEGFRESFGFK